ncbi:polysaccharide deacetylase family protein [Taibaiella chishuiensis]|uniref:Polysaccharide deacetylase n=1 Tax=Taibaiella chishuiensis TaxID=1434707 RepID=A0A2P8CVZ3_9BACT|nr:polysaccharide deacetylase family protein [Taibaiella chishuiensis]PSK89099.1 polysaccharide deacetylase [Taibaiella chishuiensis]
MIRWITTVIIILLCLAPAAGYGQVYLSLSFDDPQTTVSPVLSWQQRNAHILQTLHKHKLQSILFVCGKRVNTEDGAQLLQSWDGAGHSLAHHSWSHRNFGAAGMDLATFREDFLRCDSLIKPFRHYTRLYRFPYLKEGERRAQIDSCRDFLATQQYANGYVSIDASDWYIDGLLRDTLAANPNANTGVFRDFYIRHILERSYYYDSLATALTGRKVKHVLLLHHNLLNALLLDDLIVALKQQHFIFIDAAEAYRDPLYRQHPATVPAGESIIWSMAKATGRYEDQLRYPAEDGVYEEAALRALLQQAAKH